VVQVLDLTGSPAGGFGTMLLAALGYAVARPRVADAPLDETIYHRRKTRVDASDLATLAPDVIVVDAWREEMFAALRAAALAARGAALVLRLDDLPGQPGRRVTGFVLDHALGYSDEFPAGNPYRGQGYPPVALPGRLSDHDIGTQVANTVLGWLGATAEITLSLAGAAAQTHRFHLAEADLEPSPPGRFPNDGALLGGVVECRDGWIQLVMMTEATWRAAAEWLGQPDWARDPAYPTRPYLTAHTPTIAADLLAWAKTKTVAEVLALAYRDAVPTAPFRSAEEALAQEHWQREGFATEVPAPRPLTLPTVAVTTLVPATPPAIDRPAPPADVRRPLAGLVVVDFTVAQAGSQAGWWLCQLGATVIKIENRDKPDFARMWNPDAFDTSFSFLEPNAAKQSLLIQWHTEEGRAIFQRLIARADVFLTNVRYKTLRANGLDPEAIRAINPRLLVVSVSTDGTADVARRERPGWAMTFAAGSGLSQAVTPDGAPPSEIGAWGDYTVGNVVGLGALHGLRIHRPGTFTHVDVNATVAMATLIIDTAAIRQGAADDPAVRALLPRDGERLAVDTTPAVAAGHALRREELEGLDDAALARLGVAYGIQRSVEQVRETESGLGWQPLGQIDEHPILGFGRRTVAIPLAMDGERLGTTVDAPWLGQHTFEIARDLIGMSDAEIEAAHQGGAIG
jgi:crotonobetainyl-CoA:carnitine CoA-transferase CaiB-like acyl-CoA transferase